MGALLNQSMFLILIGIMKGKTMGMIGQDFRNVSTPGIGVAKADPETNT